MNGTKVVFDTCAIIKLLDGKDDLASRGDDIDQAQQFTSVIVRMEMLAKPGITPDEERKIREFLADMVVAPLDDSVEKIAVEIRRSTSVKLPDCIIAATAIALDAVLLTDDQGLKKLVWPGLKTVSV
jgi:predicted nucleic acid-binding protein